MKVMRGAAASRQREAMHGGVMKENMNGSYIVLLSARKKMMDFKKKKKGGWEYTSHGVYEVSCIPMTAWVDQ